MEDMLIKGTGNSRWLKSVANIMTLYPTYESFAEALAAGTFPIDLNGINPAGVETSGTKLGKASLLTDATAALLGLAATATPNDAFKALNNAPPAGILKTIVLTTSGFWTVPGDVLGNVILVYRIGGGGGGGGGNAAPSYSTFSNGAGGGGSGFLKADLLQVTVDKKLSYTIGAGGRGGTGARQSASSGQMISAENGSNGGLTTFTGLVEAWGGKGGTSAGKGGQGYSGGGGGGTGGSNNAAGTDGGDGGSYGSNGGSAYGVGGLGFGFTIYSGAKGSTHPSHQYYNGGGGGGGGGLTANETAYGGGGDGAEGSNSTNGGNDGKNGAAGVVVIQYYVKGV